MNRSEKESLYKNFFIFFTLLEILLALIFFLYFTDKKKDIYELLLNRMHICSYTLNCKEFKYDFAPKKSKYLLNKIYESKNSIYALFPLPTSKKYLLKVVYGKDKLKEDIINLGKKIFYIFFLATLIISLLAFILTLYSLKPIRDALKINQEFIKDILHDFNTPISAIRLNVELLKKNCKSPYLDRITKSIDTIVSLQENLRLFLKNIKKESKQINVNSLVKSRVSFFKSLYPNLRYKVIDKSRLNISTQEELFTRIIDNIISNASKYNKRGGYVYVIVDKNKIVIEDSGRGIKNPKKVFDRFYKESDRGIGIGLSIVKKLCDELDIKIDIESEPQKGTRVILKPNNSFHQDAK